MDAIKAAAAQSVFREVNERVRDLNNAVEYMDIGDLDECFTCECARQDCKEHLMMSLDAYEEIRRIPTHFCVAPRMRHVFQDIERIFETFRGYWVVEKFGEAGLAATELDPRLRPRPGLTLT
jgi:hypothetical protein